MQLRRITSTGRFVPEIDGLRCVAICSVVLYHLGGFLGWRVAEHGYRGVNLFYVISGFILGLPFAAHYLQQKPPVKLRSYFLRRLTRLEPPYLLSLLICFGGLVWLQGRDWRELLPGLAASAGYVHSLWFGSQSAINPVITEGFHPWIQALLYGLVLTLISVVYFAVIERPCMRKDWPQRAWAQLRSKTTGNT